MKPKDNLFNLSIVVIQIVLSSAQNETVDICDICRCENKVVIDCSYHHHTINFTETWPNETLVYEAIILDGLSLETLPHLPKFQTKRLSLRENLIQLIDKDAFKDVDVYEELDLSINKLNTLDPSLFSMQNGSIAPFRSLKILKLNDNDLSTLRMDIFQSMHQVEVLYLGSNNFDVLDENSLKALNSLPQLKVFHLQKSGLKRLPDSLFDTHSIIEELDLSQNELLYVPTHVLGKLNNLKILRLSDNPIFALTSDSFQNMKSLKVLSISSMSNLTRIEGGSLSRLEALEELNCKMNKHLLTFSENAFLTESGSVAQPPLKTVRLSDNSLTALNYPFLPNLDSLEYLDIEGNPWICDCRNNWLVFNLTEIIKRQLNGSDLVAGLICNTPAGMRGKSFTKLMKTTAELSCEDNEPSSSFDMFVGILIGTVLAVPLTIIIIVLWRRQVVYCRQGTKVHYVRTLNTVQMDYDDIL